MVKQGSGPRGAQATGQRSQMHRGACAHIERERERENCGPRHFLRWVHRKSMSRVGETLATCRVSAPPSPLPHEDDRPSSPTSRRRQRAITSALLSERRRDPTRIKNTHESEPGKRCSNNSNKRVHGHSVSSSYIHDHALRCQRSFYET